MNGKQAQQLALELLNAGILIQATVQPAVRPQQPYARRHEGHAAIWGVWGARGTRGHPAIIGCAHVAEALVAAGKWTVEAIRACQHTAAGQDPEATWPPPANLQKPRKPRRNEFDSHMAAFQ